MIAVDWVEALPGPYEGIGRIIQMRGAAHRSFDETCPGRRDNLGEPAVSVGGRTVDLRCLGLPAHRSRRSRFYYESQRKDSVIFHYWRGKSNVSGSRKSAHGCNDTHRNDRNATSPTLDAVAGLDRRRQAATATLFTRGAARPVADRPDRAAPWPRAGSAGHAGRSHRPRPAAPPSVRDSNVAHSRRVEAVQYPAAL